MKKTGLFFIIILIIFISCPKIAFCFNENDFYEINTENCDRITQVRASHILVETQAEALKIRREILDGKTFAQATREYSICPSSEEGGDLGYFEKDMMVLEFENVAFSLPLKELSEPVQTPFGWHLILVTDKK